MRYRPLAVRMNRRHDQVRDAVALCHFRIYRRGNGERCAGTRSRNRPLKLPDPSGVGRAMFASSLSRIHSSTRRSAGSRARPPSFPVSCPSSFRGARRGSALRHFLFLVSLGVVTQPPGQGDPNARPMQEVPVRTLAAATHEARSNQLGHKFPNLPRHPRMVSRDTTRGEAPARIARSRRGCRCSAARRATSATW